MIYLADKGLKLFMSKICGEDIFDKVIIINNLELGAILIPLYYMIMILR